MPAGSTVSRYPSGAELTQYFPQTLVAGSGRGHGVATIRGVVLLDAEMLHSGNIGLGEDGLVVDLSLADGNQLGHSAPLVGRQLGVGGFDSGGVLNVPQLKPPGVLLKHLQNILAGYGSPADI